MPILAPSVVKVPIIKKIPIHFGDEKKALNVGDLVIVNGWYNGDRHDQCFLVTSKDEEKVNGILFIPTLGVIIEKEQEFDHISIVEDMGFVCHGLSPEAKDFILILMREITKYRGFIEKNTEKLSSLAQEGCRLTLKAPVLL